MADDSDDNQDQKSVNAASSDLMNLAKLARSNKSDDSDDDDSHHHSRKPDEGGKSAKSAGKAAGKGGGKGGGEVGGRVAQGVMRLIARVAGYVIAASVLLSILAGLGLAPFLGCYLRYPSQSGTLTTTSTVTLYGSGMSSYNPVDTNATTSNLSYGQWTKVNLAIKGGGSLSFQAQGSVSLCKAYYPDTGTQEIPRVGDSSWFNLKLPAANSTYTLTEVFSGDLVQVKVGANSSSSSYSGYSSLYDPTTKSISISPSANCSDGQTSYDSICGKYTYYYGTYYTSSCSDTGYCSDGDGGGCVLVKTGTCDPERDGRTDYTDIGYNCDYQTGTHKHVFCRYTYYNCYKYNASTLYNPYYSYNVFLSGDSTSLSTPSGSSYGLCGSVPTISKTWFTFDQVSGSNTQGGLKYSISNSSTSSQTVSVIDNCGTTNPSGCHNFSDRYIFDNSNSGGIGALTSTNGYMQYTFNSQEPYTNQNGYQYYGSYKGGYVLSLQQTKCYRTKGSYSSDRVYTNRGAVRYLILDVGTDPNSNTSMSAAGTGQIINFINGDSSTQSITADQDGVLWLRIDNNASDYSVSNGSYEVTVSQGSPVAVSGDFDLWTWIHGIFSDAFGNLTTQLFQNLTCYGASDQSSCFNLFQIIRALLVAYIIVFAILFLIGMIQVDYYDFLQRIVKIIIIGGLINGKTFDFFNNYLFNIIFSFSDSLMNSAVFFPTTNGSGGLGNFIQAIFATFGQDIFTIQLLAMLGTGFTGIIMFILILISLILFLIPIFNLMVVTLISYFFVSVLLGMAPIFLIFILFKPTQHIFKQWITYIIAYLFEPVMLYMGIVILAKLFMIYIDYVLGYSVCFKCNAVFTIPFISTLFPILDVVLNKMPIFCIYWLSPWGYDTMSFNYGQALTNVIALFCIASATHHYTSMCNQLVGHIFGVDTAGGGIAGEFSRSAIQKAAQTVR